MFLSSLGPEQNTVQTTGMSEAGGFTERGSVVSAVAVAACQVRPWVLSSCSLDLCSALVERGMLGTISHLVNWTSSRGERAFL